MPPSTGYATFGSDRAGGGVSGGVGPGGAGDAAEQIGPMLRSVLRLLGEIGPEELMSLPLPPLPVGLRKLQDGRIYLGVLVTLAGEGESQREETLGSLRRRGLRVTTVAGDIVAGNVDLADVSSLAAAAGQNAFIEAAAAVRGELDVSVPEAWNGRPGSSGSSVTGRGVVVGIVDSGVDVSHPSLRTASGGTRISAIWDQTLDGFSAPPTGYVYGSEWDAAAIDAYLLAASPMVFPSTDVTGHGTAVAGIAASNGLAAPGGRYVGIAPEADVVVVVLESRTGVFASSHNVIDAVKYVLETAAARGRRAVVNLSQGAQIGPHDPAGSFERAVTALLTADSQHVVVKSIGNMGKADAHARVVIPTGGVADLEIHVPRTAGPFVAIDLWYELGDRIAIELMDPARRLTARVLGSQHGVLGTDAWEIDGLPNVLGVRANQMQVKIHPVTYTGDVSPGTWRLRIHGVFMGVGRPVHAWLERSASTRSARFLAPFNDPDFTLTAPACADEVLTVGSYALAPTIGPLSDFSGRGPARKGIAPGLICAPGEPVTTLAPSATHAVAHTAKQGTSFAAAHVTGAIALMLEANNALTRSQLYDCLLKNARTDADTSVGPSTAWGSGKLDIAAALQCAAVPAQED